MPEISWSQEVVDGLRKMGRIDDFAFKFLHGLGLGNLGRFGGAYSEPSTACE